ncbi:MAG: hypothetical protein ABIK79_03105 [Chloroflexota bacterium]
MSNGARRIKLRGLGPPSWPQVCVLCLEPATKEGTLAIGGKRALYCDDCDTRVKRLQNWKDGLFMISLLIGVLGAIGCLIGVIVQEGWIGLFRTQNWLAIMAGGFIFMGIAYALMWLLLLPLRLILHSRLAAPGVKILKSKDPGVTVLRFSNPGYADMFRRANGLAVLGVGR